MPRNLIGGVATIVIGVAYLAMAHGLRASALSDSVGPAGFPKALAYALILLGIVLCAQSLVAIRAKRSVVPAGGPSAAADGAPDGEDFGGLRGVLKAVGMLALGVLYLMIVR